MCAAGSAEAMGTAAGGTKRSCAGWEEQKGHPRCRPDGAWRCAGLGEVVFLSTKALQRSVLRMVSGSDPFWLEWVLKMFAVIFILPVYLWQIVLCKVIG